MDCEAEGLGAGCEEGDLRAMSWNGRGRSTVTLALGRAQFISLPLHNTARGWMSKCTLSRIQV
jgi:hypothetical protein